jgi:plasmid stabilization system protein ParE
MKHAVVILKSAEQDLQDLRNYLLEQFGRAAWLESYALIKTAINSLRAFPFSGSVPEALEEINLAQYRQLIAGKNRIIYEVRQPTIYVHIVADCRRDMKTLLMRRLLRVDG